MDSRRSQIAVDQGVIRANIEAYLRSNGRNEAVAAKFVTAAGKGHCSGISPLWLYAKWLQTQPKRYFPKKNPDEQSVAIPRDDYDWFKSTVELISNWQEPEMEIQIQLNRLAKLSYREAMARLEELSKTKPQEATRLRKLMEDNKQIDRFISHISFFFDSFEYLSISNIKLNSLLQDTREERSLKQEYSIASLFTRNQVRQLLETENIIQEGKLILVTSHNHSTALFKTREGYYYFDPNSKTGEVFARSADEVAKLIFDANFSDHTAASLVKYDNPYPLIFNMFSFDETISKPYPTQKEVLDRINPALVPILNRDLYLIPGFPRDLSGLSMAAKSGCIESVQYFLDRGCDINITDEVGYSPLRYAAYYGHFDIVKMLLNRGAIVKASDFHTSIELFILALRNGDLETAKRFETEVDGRIVLSTAIIRGYIDIVTYLLAKGTDFTATDTTKKTPMIYAVQYGNTDILRLLLDKHRSKFGQANLDERIYDGKTMLILAIEQGNIGTVVELLTQGADFTVADSKGKNPLMHAVLYGNYDVIQMLLRAYKDKSIEVDLGSLGLTYKDRQKIFMKAVKNAAHEIAKLFLPQVKADSFKRLLDNIGKVSWGIILRILTAVAFTIAVVLLMGVVALALKTLGVIASNTYYGILSNSLLPIAVCDFLVFIVAVFDRLGSPFKDLSPIAKINACIKLAETEIEKEEMEPMKVPHKDAQIAASSTVSVKGKERAIEETEVFEPDSSRHRRTLIELMANPMPTSESPKQEVPAETLSSSIVSASTSRFGFFESPGVKLQEKVRKDGAADEKRSESPTSQK